MLLVIVGHSEFAIGPSEYGLLRGQELALNVAGRVAVPLFLLLAGEHIGPRLLGNRAPGASGVYVRRLATLFLGTTLFYWLVDIAKLARHRGLGPALTDYFARQAADPAHLLLYGARPHLWFLVALMAVVVLAAFVLARARVRTFVLASAALYGVGLALGPYSSGAELQHGGVWLEWLLQSPLFFALGLFFGLERDNRPRDRMAWTLIAAGLAIHALEVYWISSTHGVSPFRLAMLLGTVPYVAGAGMLALSPEPTRVDRWLARFAGFVPVVYLIHIAFIETLLPPRGRFPEVAVRVALPVMTILLSFASAALLGRLWMRVRRLRRRSSAEPPAAMPAVP